MRTSTLLALCLGLMVSVPAYAKKLPEIHKTGINEFDPTFMKAKTIHTDLDTVRSSLKTANKNLATTLALPETTSLSDSLAELKKRGNNKIQTVLEDGKWPKLSATDAVPSDVSAGIEAVNGLVDALKTSEATLASMPEASKALVSTASKFPSQLNADMLTSNNLSLIELPSLGKKVKNNVKAVKGTPERVERVTDLTVNMTGQVIKAFPVK